LSLLILLSFSAIGLNYFRKALREKYSYLSQKLVKSSMEQERKLIGSNLSDILPNFDGYLIDGQYINTKIFSSKIYLMIFFDQNDCPYCLLEMPVWNEIHHNYPDSIVKVIGIANGITKNNLSVFLRTKSIDFEIIYDKDDKIKEKLGILRTPVRLILDHDFKILDIERPSAEDFASKRLNMIIDKLVKTY